MIKMFKTLDGQIRQIERLEPGSWISVTAPTEAEKEYLIRESALLPNLSRLRWMKRKAPTLIMTTNLIRRL